MHFPFLNSFLPLFLSLIVFVQNKMKEPPVPIWNKTLSEYFSTHNSTNYINIEPRICLNNESLYFFVMHTIIKIEGMEKDAETLGYTGLCLPEYNSSSLDQLLLNFYYLWDEGKMNSSSLIEIQNLDNIPYSKDKYNIKMKFFGTILIIYLTFVIISTIFPKKIVDKYNIKEFERIKKEREEDEEDNNNIDNINNEDYNNNYNLFKINNDEDKPPADIITGLSNNKNISSVSNGSISSEKIENDNKINENNREIKNVKKEAPLINEVNIYNELFYSKTKRDQLWNSFNLWQNIKFFLECSQLKKFSKLNQIEKEIFIMETFKCLSYFIMMLYTCIPVIERLPFKHPEKFFKLVKHPLLLPIINGNYFYNTIFLIEGIYISYFYLYNKKNYCLSYILLEILYKILPLYFLVIVLYFIFVNSHIFLDTPLSKYFFEKDRENCECQELNIFLFIANFTYGMKDKFFPFCLYHFWFVFNWVQYYIVGMFLLLCYLNFKSFFYVIFIIIYFIGFLLRIISLNIYMAPVSVFDVLNRNLKPYYERQGIKIFTRGGPFLIGFLFGIYYFQNKKKILNNKKYNNMLIFLSITFFFTVFVFQHCVNLNLLNRDYIFIVLIQYIFKILKYDFFVLGVLGFLLYFFINADKAGKIFRIFNNHAFLYMKKLSLTSYLIFSIMARIFFYSFEKVFNIKWKRIVEYIFLGIPIALVIGFFLNVLFVLPLQRVNLIIKSTYIKNSD